MIIGVTGLYASGKDTVADYLVKYKGFDHFSLSAILREEAKKANIEPTRENLIKFATSLKDVRGHDVLSQLADERISGNSVLTSIRHPKEVQYFNNKYPNFKLIVVDADPKTRYQRMKDRARDSETSLSFDQFINNENKERGKGGGQEFDEVFKLSDIILDNNKDFNHLYKQVEELLVKIEEADAEK